MGQTFSLWNRWASGSLAVDSDGSGIYCVVLVIAAVSHRVLQVAAFRRVLKVFVSIFCNWFEIEEDHVWIKFDEVRAHVDLMHAVELGSVGVMGPAVNGGAPTPRPPGLTSREEDRRRMKDPLEEREGKKKEKLEELEIEELEENCREWRQKQLRKITDRVFDHFKDDYGKDHLAFEDLYIAVLFVYNDINKHLPGPHIDPPPKASVKAMMEYGKAIKESAIKNFLDTYDTNLDGQLDGEEFADFIQKLTGDTLCVVSRNLIIAMVVAPMVALMTKRATEGVPGVGKVVQRLPNSVYASIVALGVMLIQRSSEECD
ncbi:hypothetical protein ACLOJK_039921 [Asimina triloba]